MTKDEVWDKIKSDMGAVYGEPMLHMFLKLAESLKREHWDQLTPPQKSLTNPDIRMGFAANVQEAERAAKDGSNEFNAALVSGAANGDIELCRWSVEKGARAFDDALMEAAGKGHADICQFLVEKGATMFVKAIKRSDNPEVSKILIKAWREKVGSNIRLQNASNAKEAERALKAGANRLDYKTVANWFHQIRTDLVMWWLKNEEMLGREKIRKTSPFFFGMALEKAADAGDFAMCRIIVEEGLEKHTRGALENAAYRGHIKICRLFLDRQEWNPDSLEGPLYKAAKGGQLEVCKLLVQRGAKPSLNALGGAVESGKLEVCRWFVEDMGAPVSYGLVRNTSSPDVKEYITKKLQEQK